MTDIRQITQTDIPQCVDILRALPDWFGIESAIIDYGRELLSLDGLVAIEKEKIVGFSGHKRYAETRAFWQAKGFLPMNAHEIWGPENPCLVMVQPR